MKKFRVCPHGELYGECALCKDNAEDDNITRILRLYGRNYDNI